MCGQGLKMLKISFLDLLFAISCGQGLEMLKMSFVGLLLAICAARD